MTPKEAVDFLDSICSQVRLSREDHCKVQQATMTLQKFIDQPGGQVQGVGSVKPLGEAKNVA